eukprot:COSAG03_NODE_10580_length_642_cov_0.578269_2_plen_104_part_00
MHVYTGESVTVTSYHGHRWVWRPRSHGTERGSDSDSDRDSDRDKDTDRDRDSPRAEQSPEQTAESDSGELVLNLERGTAQKHEMVGRRGQDGGRTAEGDAREL